MHIEGCQLSQIIQGTQDFGPYLPQPCLQGSLLPFPMEREREREILVWFGHMAPEQNWKLNSYLLNYQNNILDLATLQKATIGDKMSWGTSP